MATKTQSKSDAEKEAAVKVDVFDDLSTAADYQVGPFGFAEVIKGKNEGRYAAVLGRNNDGDIVLRTRDDLNERLVEPPGNLRPAPAGRR